MFYEITIKHTTVADSGRIMTVKEKFIVKNADTFSEAEAKGYEYIKYYSFEEAYVVAIKQSNLNDIIGEPTGTTKLYIASIENTMLNEKSGKEIKKHFPIAIFAESINDAKISADKYNSISLSDSAIIKLYETNFVEVI